MPAKVKVRILAGRNLPVMDKSSDASDAFAEVKLANTTYKTEVYRRSLNPFWNSEWFRFEVSDDELQDEPLQIRIMDYDTYSANDAIGKVYINLNPLLVNSNKSMSGWLPIYDTMHGIRGEINCMIKVNLFADSNRYRQSSCGVRFFFSDIPNGYRCDALLGFVEELLVSDDPEYQWIDKIRTPRASNEARQTLFTKLSGEVQRKLGLKAEIFGGNAVIGYQQSFNLEGNSGIVGRGIGTAVILSKIENQQNLPEHNLFKQNYLPKQLTHSISADFFIEKTKMPFKNKFSISEISKPDTFYLQNKVSEARRIIESLDSDLSETDDLIEDGIKVQSDDQAITTPSLPKSQSLAHDLYKTPNFKRLISFFPIKLPPDTRKLSSQLPKIYKLKLTKYVPFQKFNKNNSLSCRSIPDVSNNVEEKVSKITNFTEHVSLSSTSSLGASSKSILQTQQSSNSSKSLKSTKDILPSTQLVKQIKVSQQRRRQKSQSTSADDQLSTIEEKVDDDMQNSNQRGRSASNGYSAGSNSKIDSMRRLSDNQVKSGEVDANFQSRAASNSSLSMEEEDEPGYSSVKTKSSSTMDELTQADDLSLAITNSNNLRVSQSLIDSNARSELCKSGKSFSNSLRLSDTNLIAKKDNSLDRKNLDYSNLSSQSSRDGIHNKPDRLNQTFAGSVQILKTQQHLLQTLIRNQNQGLMVNSYAKTKNLFIFPNRVHQAEYPFVTIRKFPAGLVKKVGGVVSVHSVKLLDNIINDDESETRDSWWIELRKEIRSHAKALNCNVILGYRETSQVLVDVCILSASGTAAVIEPNITNEYPIMCNRSDSALKASKSEAYEIVKQTSSAQNLDPKLTHETNNSLKSEFINPIDCSFCHAPLECKSLNSSYTKCSICFEKAVPDILLMTIEPPSNVNVASPGILVQARVCRAKRDSHGEASAKEIGDALLFLEYELHRQLISKLKFKGLNCLFGLVMEISVGENMISALATGTGCFVYGLPIPCAPKIVGKGIKPTKLMEIQKLLENSAAKNREALRIDDIIEKLIKYHDEINELKSTFDNGGDLSQPNLTNNVDNITNNDKSRLQMLMSESNIVLEVDDSEDAEIIALLIDNEIPKGYSLCNSETLLGIEQEDVISMNMFTQVMRTKLNGLDQFQQQFDWIIQSLLVKLRRSLPCCITNLNFVVDLPESAIVQITVTGCVIGLKNIISNNTCMSSIEVTEQNEVKQFSSSYSPSRSSSSSSLSNSSSSSTSKRSDSSTSSSESLGRKQETVNDTNKLNKLQAIAETKQTQVAANNNSLQSSPDIPVKSALGFKSLIKPKSSSNLVSLAATAFKSSKETNNIKQLNAKKSRIAEIQMTNLNTVPNARFAMLSRNNLTGTVRAVFKKQLTYPGAAAPSISGQDDIISQVEKKNFVNQNSKATQLFNRVKQPLKDLGANFNTTINEQTNQASLLNGKSSLFASSKNFAHSSKTKLMSSDNIVASGSEINIRRTDDVDGNDIRNNNCQAANTANSKTKKSKKSSNSRNNETQQQPHSTSLISQPSPVAAQAMQNQTNSLDKNSNSCNIDITSLSYIPGCKNYQYLGNLSFSFVRESSSVRENDGLNGFIHSFLMEVYAIIRAHVSALGGNAFLSFKIQQSCIFYHSNKNQAQCLISVAGDAASASC